MAALGTALGLVGAGRPSIWTDEAITLSMLRRPLGEMLGVVVGRADAVHGVYYLALRLWTSVAGDSIEGVRAFSALGLGVAAGTTVLLASRYLELPAAVAAGIGVAVLPGLTWTAVEARGYAWAVALAVLATTALDSACARGTRRSWAAYGAVCVLACWWHLSLVLLVLAHGIAVLAGRRGEPGPRRAWATTAAVVALGVTPVAAVAWRQRDQVAWLADQHYTWHAMLIRALSGSYPSEPVDTRVVLLVGLLLLVALGAEHLWLSGERWPALLLGTWAVLPLAAGVASALGDAGVAHPRYLTFAGPALVVLAAAGTASIPRQAVVAVGAGVLLVAVPVVVAQRAPDARPHDLLSVAAAAEESQADAVFFTTPLARSAAFAYPAAFDEKRDLSRLPWGKPDPFFDETRAVDDLAPRHVAGRRVLLVGTAEGVRDVAVFSELGCRWRLLHHDRGYRVRLYRCP